MPSFLSPLVARLIGAGLIVLLVAGLWLRGEHYQGRYEGERTAHALTKANVARAQDQALAAAVAARNQAEARYRALAEQRDYDHAKTLTIARSATDRFITGNRCVRPESPSGASGRTATAAPSGRAVVPAGTGPAAELVAVDADDIAICTENTVRLEQVREWALSLAP